MRYGKTTTWLWVTLLTFVTSVAAPAFASLCPPTISEKPEMACHTAERDAAKTCCCCAAHTTEKLTEPVAQSPSCDCDFTPTPPQEQAPFTVTTVHPTDALLPLLLTFDLPAPVVPVYGPVVVFRFPAPRSLPRAPDNGRAPPFA